MTLNTSRTLALTARILGTVLLAFLLFMLIGTLSGDSSEPDGFQFRDTKDLVGFLLFPVCTIIGLALAYKWPLLGGGIAVASTSVLVALRPDLLQLTFLIMVTPGLLYMVYGLIERSRVRAA
jgi:hypothetical protein